mgnify:FL=1
MMKIYRYNPNVSFYKIKRGFNKFLNDDNYNGYTYLITTITNGVPEILRIGSTGRGSRGLSLYRVTRNFKEWGHKLGGGRIQTNMIGKYFSRSDCKVFIFPTKKPYEQTYVEASFKIKHMKKHGRIPRFDRDIQYKYLVSNDEWQK